MRRCSKVLVVWVRSLCMLAFVPAAFAQEFTLQVGLPIAGNARQAKNSLLVVRPGGCADPASAQITATAEGLVEGARRSVPLTLAALPTPGVHAVLRDWASGGATAAAAFGTPSGTANAAAALGTPSGGVWIVNLVGTCAGRTAGAIVPVGPNATFRREAVKLLAHRPTPAEIDDSLKALTTGGQK